MVPIPTLRDLTAGLFKSRTGASMIHVPCKGSPPAVAAVLGGEASVSFPTTAAALPQVRAGKLLAVTGPERSPVFPEGAPTKDTLPDFVMLLYSRIMGPAKMPGVVVARPNAEIAKSLKEPAVLQAWARYSAEPVTSTPEAFTAHLTREIERLGTVVKSTGARID